MTRPGFRPLSPMLPPDAHARIAGELESGERLIWEAQPIAALYSRSGIPVMLFGVVFGGFAAFWILAASGMIWSSHGPRESGLSIFSCFPLFGIPFLLAGLGMITAPIWMRRSALRTVYGLTNRRAIICKGRPLGGVEVRSFGPAELTNLTRVEHSSGAGDLVFREIVSDTYDSRGNRNVNRTRIGFLAIPNPREVEEMIRRELVTPHQQEHDAP